MPDRDAVLPRARGVTLDVRTTLGRLASPVKRLVPAIRSAWMLRLFPPDQKMARASSRLPLLGALRRRAFSTRRLLVASTESAPPPHRAVTTPAVLDATGDESLQRSLPPTRNSGLHAGLGKVLVADRDGDRKTGDEEKGARAGQRIPDGPPLDKPEEVEELESGRGIVGDELRVSAAGVDNQSKNLRVRGDDRYNLDSRVLMTTDTDDDSQTAGNQGGEAGSEETLVIIWIVVGCGIVTLVVLCIVRKVRLEA